MLLVLEGESFHLNLYREKRKGFIISYYKHETTVKSLKGHFILTVHIKVVASLLKLPAGSSSKSLASATHFGSDCTSLKLIFLAAYFTALIFK